MRYASLVALVALLGEAPAWAEVIARSDQGFIVRHEATVKADPAVAWAALGRPARWWNSGHTHSGDAANLSIDLVAGGCFCETLPAEPRATARGSVEHARVIHVNRERLLRMAGSLGPLQSEAVQGVLSITMKPLDGGTQITWEYVVGGYMRLKSEMIAPAVDGVLRQQVAGLVAQIERAAAAK